MEISEKNSARGQDISIDIASSLSRGSSSWIIKNYFGDLRSDDFERPEDIRENLGLRKFSTFCRFLLPEEGARGESEDSLRANKACLALAVISSSVSLGLSKFG